MREGKGGVGEAKEGGKERGRVKWTYPRATLIVGEAGGGEDEVPLFVVGRRGASLLLRAFDEELLQDGAGIHASGNWPTPWRALRGEGWRESVGRRGTGAWAKPAVISHSAAARSTQGSVSDKTQAQKPLPLDQPLQNAVNKSGGLYGLPFQIPAPPT